MKDFIISFLLVAFFTHAIWYLDKIAVSISESDWLLKQNSQMYIELVLPISIIFGSLAGYLVMKDEKK